MIINFTDGSSITTQQAADLIRAEGELGSLFLVTRAGLRCAMGVIQNAYLSPADTERYPVNQRPMTFMSERELKAELGESVHRLNDAFTGTPAQRAEYMAKLMEAI